MKNDEQQIHDFTEVVKGWTLDKVLETLEMVHNNGKFESVLWSSGLRANVLKEEIRNRVACGEEGSEEAEKLTIEFCGSYSTPKSGMTLRVYIVTDLKASGDDPDDRFVTLALRLPGEGGWRFLFHSPYGFGLPIPGSPDTTAENGVTSHLRRTSLRCFRAAAEMFDNGGEPLPENKLGIVLKRFFGGYAASALKCAVLHISKQGEK